ncbi:MAG TPA: deoxyribodipyrimidine photo-lyase [Acidimicrobiales bacterium]
MSVAVVWFRRDLRLADHPALLAALDAADEVVPLFVLDPRLQRSSGSPRLAFLAGCLAELDQRTGGHLVIRTGDPATVVPAVAAEAQAANVFVTADFGPYGGRRDAAVDDALAGGLLAVDSPYAVAPGDVTTADGGSFKVFTPFHRRWKEHGWGIPEAEPTDPPWATGLRSEPVPQGPDLGGTTILPPGEAAGRARLADFAERVAHYAKGRDFPAEDATSRLSVYLKFGCIHPRQALDAVKHRKGEGAERFRAELAWRDFYASVLAAFPRSARHSFKPEMAAMKVDTGPDADRRFQAWAAGRTGYPIVDAGMRQLREEAWMHNRVRMIVASFLVKDLHLDWVRGADLFLDRLQDGDLASNNHGWQWVAGTGTDPAPFFRIFNPTSQGKRFDPDGDYVRRWVPELRHVVGGTVHEPWKLAGGVPPGYPHPIVDHDEERKEALARYARIREHTTERQGRPPARRSSP